MADFMLYESCSRGRTASQRANIASTSSCSARCVPERFKRARIASTSGLPSQVFHDGRQFGTQELAAMAEHRSNKVVEKLSVGNPPGRLSLTVIWRKAEETFGRG